MPDRSVGQNDDRTLSLPLICEAASGTAVIAIAIGGAVFFFGGYFNVAASAPDPGFVNWVLTKVRMPIDHPARVTGPLNLDDTGGIHDPADGR